VGPETDRDLTARCYRQRVPRLLVALLLSLFAGCGDVPTAPDAGPAFTICDDGLSSPVCPPLPPTLGDACDDALTCRYCREDAVRVTTCNGLAWALTATE